MRYRLAALGLFAVLAVLPGCAKKHARKDSGPATEPPSRVENFDPTKPRAEDIGKQEVSLVEPD